MTFAHAHMLDGGDLFDTALALHIVAANVQVGST